MQRTSRILPPSWAHAARAFARRDLFHLLFLAGLPLVYFWRVTLAQSIWFGGDFFQISYPFGVELSRALKAGRLPFWTNDLLTGYPLFAEGQAGSLYPLNLVLFRFLPAQLAISYELLFHLAWVGCGMYLLARALGLVRAGALVAGLAFSFNGFLFAHLAHPPMVAAIAWLPWLVLFQNRLQTAHVERRPGAAIWFGLLALGLGIQFLAGSVQVSLLNVLVLGCFGLTGRWVFLRGERVQRRNAARIVSEMLVEVALPVLLGAGMAAMQLLPTAELVGYSIRGGGLSEAEFGSFSLPPAFLTQFFSPYLSGEPSGLNTEFFAYFGLATCILAVLAFWLRRDRRVVFLSLFALCALGLALGSSIPLYRLLYFVPPLSYFRVPARYLMIFILTMALLAGITVDDLARRLGASAAGKLKQPSSRITLQRARTNTEAWPRFAGYGFSVLVPAALCALIIAVELVLARILPPGTWLQAWQILPFLFALLTLGAVILARTERLGRTAFSAIVLGIVLCDLLSYAPPFFAAIYTDVPPSYVEGVPRSIRALDKDLTGTRTFTDLTFYPSVPALRGSLFPNTGLIYDKPTAQAYTPLDFRKHSDYLNDPSPAMLNLLNAGYYMIPLETLATSVPGVPPSNLALDLSANPVTLPGQEVSRIRVASFTDQAAKFAQGTPLAEIELHFDDHTSLTLPFRIGIETADWDYERANAETPMAYPPPRLAHSFPAFTRAFGKLFQGHTYLAQFDLAAAGSTRKLTSIRVRPTVSEGRLVVEGEWLEDEAGHSLSLATLTHKNNFALAFQSDTVAIWRNEDVLPRALIVHAAEVQSDERAFARMRENGFQPERTVLLAQDQFAGSQVPADPREPDASGDQVQITQDVPGRVSLNISTSQPGYLVLADSWYPGWTASVDGRPVPVLRADVIFRAIPVTPGQHAVSFEYRPMSFFWGAALAALSLLVVLGNMYIGRP